MQRHVLIIDDDPPIREMLRRMLEYAGYQVTEAVDGEAGLRSFQAEPPDLVITDILMPNKEGLETIMGLRRLAPEVPIIAMSGGGHNGTLSYLQTADRLGARVTLAKPFTRQEMLDAVHTALGE